jgi:hypothetical protein
MAVPCTALDAAVAVDGDAGLQPAVLVSVEGDALSMVWEETPPAPTAAPLAAAEEGGVAAAAGQLTRTGPWAGARCIVDGDVKVQLIKGGSRLCHCWFNTACLGAGAGSGAAGSLPSSAAGDACLGASAGGGRSFTLTQRQLDKVKGLGPGVQLSIEFEAAEAEAVPPQALPALTAGQAVQQAAAREAAAVAWPSGPPCASPAGPPAAPTGSSQQVGAGDGGMGTRPEAGVSSGAGATRARPGGRWQLASSSAPLSRYTDSGRSLQQPHSARFSDASPTGVVGRSAHSPAPAATARRPASIELPTLTHRTATSTAAAAPPPRGSPAPALPRRLAPAAGSCRRAMSAPVSPVDTASGAAGRRRQLLPGHGGDAWDPAAYPLLEALEGLSMGASGDIEGLNDAPGACPDGDAAAPAAADARGGAGGGVGGRGSRPDRRGGGGGAAATISLGASSFAAKSAAARGLWPAAWLPATPAAAYAAARGGASDTALLLDSAHPSRQQQQPPPQHQQQLTRGECELHSFRAPSLPASCAAAASTVGAACATAAAGQPAEWQQLDDAWHTRWWV